MEKKQLDLSVIIPLYNAVETLERCLTNILKETEVSLEILLVDDSSVDDTPALCRKLCEKDDRVQYIRRPNGGVAAARNTGLSNARGTYVTFVDQDDWVEPETYRVTVEFAQKQDADMVVFNYTKNVGEHVEYMRNRSQIPEVTQDKNAIVKYAFFREEYRGYAAYVWNKLFRRDFLQAYQLKFADGLRRGDDVLFYSSVAACGPKTCYINADYYHYVQREDSITHTMTKENVERLSEILTGYERAMDILENAGVSKESIDYMRCFYVFHASLLYELSKEHGLLQRCKWYQNEMKRYFQAYKAQNSPYPERIRAVECMIGEDLSHE